MTDLLSAVRIEIGDTEESPGVLPGRRHFKDTEILYAAETELVTELSAPTDVQVGRVSARCLEIASTAWSSQPEETVLGPAEEKGKPAVRLAKQASILRSIWGWGNPNSGRIPGMGKPPAYSGAGLISLPPGIG
jgi:hypothetical protein